MLSSALIPDNSPLETVRVFPAWLFESGHRYRSSIFTKCCESQPFKSRSLSLHHPLVTTISCRHSILFRTALDTFTPSSQTLTPSSMAHTVTEGVLRPQLPLIWESHPHYGIVHRSGCRVCNLYIHHMTEAAFENQPSFHRAREDHKRRSTGGIEYSAGYRTELDRALGEVALLRAELEVSQSECERLKLRSTGAAVFDRRRDRAYGASAFQGGMALGRGEGANSVWLDQSTSPAGSSESEASFVTPSTGTVSHGLPASSLAGSVNSEVPTYSLTSPSSIAPSAGSSRLPQLPQLRPAYPSAPTRPLTPNQAGPSNQPALEVPRPRSSNNPCRCTSSALAGYPRKQDNQDSKDDQADECFVRGG